MLTFITDAFSDKLIIIVLYCATDAGTPRMNSQLTFNYQIPAEGLDPAHWSLPEHTLVL